MRAYAMKTAPDRKYRKAPTLSLTLPRALLGVIFASTLASSLSGCNDKLPPKDLADTAARQLAATDEQEGLIVEKLVRDNGWQDEGAANRYWIRHTYNLTLTKDLTEVILRTVQDVEKEVAKTKGGSGSSSLFGFVEEFTSSVGIAMAARLIMETKDHKERFQKLVENCSECQRYLQEAPGKASTEALRYTAFIITWAHYTDELGFPDRAKKGDFVPRQTTIKFVKTEKGWRKES